LQLLSVFLEVFHLESYGFLGSKRNPLPVGAYDAIKKALPCSKDKEFTGFELDEVDA